MSVRGGVGTRLFVAGGQEVRSEFDRTGQHATRMWSEIGAGQRTASPALRAVSTVAGEARDAVEGMAASAGGLGRSLTLLGPAGIAAGAAVGGLLIAIQNSAATAEWADELATTADLVGVNAEKLQELRHAGEVFEVGMADMDRGLQSLNAALGAMRTGVGDGRLKEAFETLGITDAQLANLESADQLLPLLADKFAALGSRADQTQLAKKLQIEELLPLLIQGSANIEEMTDKARELGLVMDEASVQGAAAMNEELRVADERLAAASRSMDTAMIPSLVAMKGALADAAQGAADLFNWLNKASAANVDGQLERRVGWAAAARNRASVLRDEDSTFRDATLAGGSGVEASTRRGRLAAAARAEAEAIRIETDIQNLSLQEQARIKALSQAGADRIASTLREGGSTSAARTGGGRSRGASSTSVSAIDSVLPYDPVTGQQIKPKSDEALARERLFGPEVRDGVKMPVQVDLLPTLQENLAVYQADFQERTQTAFADGLRAAMDGNLGDFLAARLRDSLINGLSEGLANAWTKAREALAGNPNNGGWGTIVDGVFNGLPNLFGRKAVGGPGHAGRAYSMAEYGGAELAVFGANGQVFDHTATQRMLEDIAAPRGSGQPVQVSLNYSIDARGAGPREVDALNARLDRMERDQPSRIVEVVNEGLARRMIRG